MIQCNTIIILRDSIIVYHLAGQRNTKNIISSQIIAIAAIGQLKIIVVANCLRGVITAILNVCNISVSGRISNKIIIINIVIRYRDIITVVSLVIISSIVREFKIIADIIKSFICRILYGIIC